MPFSLELNHLPLSDPRLLIGWLNPLPRNRWEYTSAWGIHGILNGKMLTYELASLETASKENPQGDMKIWQINPHQQ